MKQFFVGSIRAKLVSLFLANALVPVLAVGIMSYYSAQKALREDAISALSAISAGKEESVLRYMRTKTKVTRAVAGDDYFVLALEKIGQKGPEAPAAAAELVRYLKEEKLPADADIDLIHVIDMSGKIVASTAAEETGKDKSGDDYFVQGKNGLHIKDVYVSLSGKVCFAVSVPLKSHTTKETVGVLVIRYETRELNVILGNREGLGQSGEAYLVNRDGLMITESRFNKDAALKEKIETEPVRLFQSQHKLMRGIYRDYRGALTLGASDGDLLDKELGLGWLVVTEQDASEAFGPVTELAYKMIWMVGIAAILVIVIALYFSGAITRPIKRLSEIAGAVAAGDLTGTVPASGSDEIGVLSRSFGTMIQNLKQVLSQTQQAVNQITSASGEILAASQQQAAGAREQSAAVSETTAASKELSKSAEQVGESIKRVMDLATHTMIGMAKIKDDIGKTNQILGSLSEKSQKIGKITEVIDDVADQTNLLAVNAAIEAARAGEEGKGFTVVADEIRKLADSTAKSTKDITALIEVIQHEMTNVIMSMEVGVNSVDQEAKLSKESADRAKEIAMNATQQVSGSKQIAEAMGNIDETMKQMAASAQQSQVAAKQLAELAQGLKETAAKFKLL